MWNKVLKGIDKDRPTRRGSESIVSSSSSRKPTQADFVPSSTSYATTSQSAYPATALASVASSSVTAGGNQDEEVEVQPPRTLVRTQSMQDYRDSRDRESSRRDRSRSRDRESSHKKKHRSRSRDGDKQRKRSRSRESSHRKRRSRSRERGEEKRERRDKRDKDGDRERDRESDRGKRSKDRALDRNSDRGLDRAGPDDPDYPPVVETQNASQPFSQFPGQTSGAFTGSSSETPIQPGGGVPGAFPSSHHVQADDFSSHVQDQFPGQFPTQTAEPYRPPLSVSEGGPGFAADYYGDQGQSVHEQPGVRPQAPTLIVGAEPHLMAASPHSAPPVEPSALGSVGAAASFFGDSSAAPAESSSPNTGKPSKPGKLSSGSVGVGAAFGGAALGYAAEQMYSGGSGSKPSKPGKHSRPGRTNSVGGSSSGTAFYDAGSTAGGGSQYDQSAAGYMGGPPNASDGAGYVSASNSRPPKPGKHSSHSNAGLYAAGALGAAGLAAAAAQHHGHHNGHHNGSVAGSSTSSSGGMAFRRRRRGPGGGLIDWWTDPEGVARFEEYTEYIGVCRYCFEPGTTPRDAPRKHHYRSHGRRSTERFGSSTRVDKDSRYWSSDNASSKRRSNQKSWIATGLAGYGLATVGKQLFNSNRDFDDTYSVRSGRAEDQSRRTSRHTRRRSKSRSRSRHRSDGLLATGLAAGLAGSTRSRSRNRSRSRDRVETGVTSDGKLYKKDPHGGFFGGEKTTIYKEKRDRRSRSRSKSRSRSRERRKVQRGITSDGKVYKTDSQGGFFGGTKTTIYEDEKRSRRRSRSRSRSRDRRNTGFGTALGAAVVGSALSSHSGRRDRSRSDSPRHRKGSRYSPSGSIVSKSRSGRESNAGVLGGFFSAPSENRNRKSRSKKSKKGFFTFSNGSGSSSSADYDLAYGGPQRDRKGKSSQSKKEKDSKATDAAILGLGAGLAALVTNDSRKGKLGKDRKPEVIAVKEASSPDTRRRQSSRKSKHSSASSVEEADWESATDEDSSVDSDLAFGALTSRSKRKNRMSTDSLASNSSSGTEKWWWRWGTKKSKKRESTRPDLIGPATGGLIGAAAGAAYASGGRENYDPQAPSAMSSMSSLQHMYPTATSDPGKFDVTRANSISQQQPMYTSRPGPLPMQQPQPVSTVPSNVYAPQTGPHAYSAPTGPPVFSGTNQQSQYGPSFDATRQYAIDGNFKDDSSLQRDTRRQEQPRRRMSSPTFTATDPEFETAVAAAVHRKSSSRDQSSSMTAFDKKDRDQSIDQDLTSTSSRKESSKKRRSEEKTALERARESSKTEREKSKKSSKRSSSEKDRPSRRDSESIISKEKSDSWGAPLAAGAMGAIVGSAIVSEKKSRKDKDRKDSDRYADDSGSTKDRRTDIARKAASKISKDEDYDSSDSGPVVSILDKYNHKDMDIAAYVVPPELMYNREENEALKKEHRRMDVDLQAYDAVPQIITVEPENPVGSGYYSDNSFNSPRDVADPTLMGYDAVPKLHLIKPSPPGSTATSVKGPSPPNTPEIKAFDSVSRAQKDTRRASVGPKVTWGESETIVYSVATPDETRDEFVSNSGSSYKTSQRTSSRDYDRNAPSAKNYQRTDDQIPQASRIPGAFDDDIDFAATVAAGLADTGFDPAIVTNDPNYHRRQSPPGSEEEGYYSKPVGPLVNLDRYSIDSPGTEGAPPVRGYVEGELPETPGKESAREEPYSLKDSSTKKLSKKERKAKKKSRSKDDTLDDQFDTTTLSPPVSPNTLVGDEGRELVSEPDNYFDVPSKQKSRSQRSNSRDLEEKGALAGIAAAATAAAIDSREKKRRDKSSYDKEEFADVPEYQDAADIRRSESPKQFADDEISNGRRKRDKEDGRAQSYETRNGDSTSRRSIDPMDYLDQESDRDDPAKSRDRKTKSEVGRYESPERDARSVASESNFNDYETKRSKKKGSRSSRDQDDLDTKSIISSDLGQDGDDEPKKHRKKKHHSSHQDDSVTSPATEDQTSPTDKKSKDKKTGIFGSLFGKSTDNLANSSKPRDSTRDSKEDESQEPKKHHRKSKDRSSDSVYGDSTEASQTKESLADLSVTDNLDPDGGHRHHHRRHSRSSADKDSGHHRHRSHSRSRRDSASNAGDDDQSFLGKGSEGVPPHSDSAPASPRVHPAEPLSPSDTTSRSLPTSPSTRPTVPHETGIFGDLPSLSSPQRESRNVETPTSDRRLSALQTTDIAQPGSGRGSSPTAVPLLLKRPPPSPGYTRSGSVGSASQAASITQQPRQRSRPNSTEFRPLYLVERHKSRPEIEQDETYPSLPSSRTTSRSPSEHDPEELEESERGRDLDSQTEVISTSISGDHRKELRRHSGEMLDSGQSTPKASKFPEGILDSETKASYEERPIKSTDEVQVVPASTSTLEPVHQYLTSSPAHSPGRLVHSVEELFPGRQRTADVSDTIHGSLDSARSISPTPLDISKGPPNPFQYLDEEQPEVDSGILDPSKPIQAGAAVVQQSSYPVQDTEKDGENLDDLWGTSSAKKKKKDQKGKNASKTQLSNTKPESLLITQDDKIQKIVREVDAMTEESVAEDFVQSKDKDQSALEGTRDLKETDDKTKEEVPDEFAVTTGKKGKKGKKEKKKEKREGLSRSATEDETVKSTANVPVLIETSQNETEAEESEVVPASQRNILSSSERETNATIPESTSRDVADPVEEESNLGKFSAQKSEEDNKAKKSSITVARSPEDDGIQEETVSRPVEGLERLSKQPKDFNDQISVEQHRQAFVDSIIEGWPTGVPTVSKKGDSPHVERDISQENEETDTPQTKDKIIGLNDNSMSKNVLDDRTELPEQSERFGASARYDDLPKDEPKLDKTKIATTAAAAVAAGAVASALVSENKGKAVAQDTESNAIDANDEWDNPKKPSKKDKKSKRKQQQRADSLDESQKVPTPEVEATAQIDDRKDSSVVLPLDVIESKPAPEWTSATKDLKVDDGPSDITPTAGPVDADPASEFVFSTKKQKKKGKGKKGETVSDRTEPTNGMRTCSSISKSIADLNKKEPELNALEDREVVAETQPEQDEEWDLPSKKNKKNKKKKGLSITNSPLDSARDSPTGSSTPLTQESKNDVQEDYFMPMKGKKGKKSKKQQLEEQTSRSVGPETIPLPESNDNDLDIDEFEPIWSEDDESRLPTVPEPKRDEQLKEGKLASEEADEQRPGEEKTVVEKDLVDDPGLTAKQPEKEIYTGKVQPVEDIKVEDEEPQFSRKLSKKDKKKAKKAKNLTALDDLEDSGSSTPAVQESERTLGGSLTLHPEASTSTKDLAEGSWSFGGVSDPVDENAKGVLVESPSIRKEEESPILKEAVVEEPFEEKSLSRKQSKKDKKKAKKAQGFLEEQSSGQQTPLETIEKSKDSKMEEVAGGGLVAATTLAGSAALLHSALNNESKEGEQDEEWTQPATKSKGKKGKKGKKGQTSSSEPSANASKDISMASSPQVVPTDSESRPHRLGESATVDHPGHVDDAHTLHRDIIEEKRDGEKNVRSTYDSSEQVKSDNEEEEGKSGIWGIFSGQKTKKGKTNKKNGSFEGDREQTTDPAHKADAASSKDSQERSPTQILQSLDQGQSSSQIHSSLPGTFIETSKDLGHEIQDNRDSAVHVSDSPTEAREKTPTGQPRDSGIHVSEAPTPKGMHLSANSLPPVKDEGDLKGTSRELPGSFDSQERSGSTPKPSGSPISMESRRLTGTSTSSADPLNISVEMDPSYEVAISRPYNRDENDSDNDSNRSLEIRWKPEASASDLSREGNDSRQSLTPSQSMDDVRQPSPVEPASKERSSALFNNSPSSQRDSGDLNVPRLRSLPAHDGIPRSDSHGTTESSQDQTPRALQAVDYTPKDRHGKDLFGPSPPSNEQTRDENRSRSLAALSGASSDHEEPYRSIFGGPIGNRPDLHDSPSTPFGTTASDKRRLNTIKEADSPTDESPLGRKGRSLSTEQSNQPRRSLRHTSSPLHPDQAQLESGSRDAKDFLGPIQHDHSHGVKDDGSVLSTDDLMSRLSWPTVDDDQHTVDLERAKSRERRLPSGSRHGNESPHGNTLGTKINERRAPSGGSDRSNGSAKRYITPDKDQFRPGSVLSSRSANSTGTPPLRRVDRSLSGDLRAASKRTEAKLAAREAELANLPSSSTYDPLTDKGKGRARDMTDIYEGWGDVHGSPMSPTRPPSVRRRQSTQILDLEAKMEHLVSENRKLVESKSQVEQSLQEALEGHQNTSRGLSDSVESRDSLLREKDDELERLKGTLDWLHKEVTRLTEANEGLSATTAALAATHREEYGALKADHDDKHQQLESTSRELDDLRNQHGELSSGMEGVVRQEIESALQDKNSEIDRLRSELSSAQAQIHTLQQQILSSRPSEDFLVLRDEDYFDSECQKLCQHVQQWVLRFSKFSDMRGARLADEVSDEKIVDRLENAILDGTDVDEYLTDRVKRRDVFMSVVMTMVWEFIFTRYLFGMDREQRQKLKALEKILMEVGPESAVQKWRATTLTLLSRRPAFQSQRESDTEAVVQEIYHTLSSILPPPMNLTTQITDSLRNVLNAAVELSIEMRTQTASYMMLPPLQPEYDTNGDLARKVSFNAAMMNERSGGGESNEELEDAGAVVRMVLFPLVVKKAGEDGEEIVVCPAQVLVGGRPKRVGFAPSQGMSPGGPDPEADAEMV